MSVGLAVLVFLVCVAVLALVTDLLVDGVTVISERLRIPGSIAGATIAAASTSAPEFGTTVFGLMKAESTSDAAFGDLGIAAVLGSALFNLAVIGGIVGVFFPAVLERKVITRDTLFYAITVGLLVALIWFGSTPMSLDSTEAWILMGTYGVYLIWIFIDARAARATAPEQAERPVGKAILKVAAALVAVIIACHFLVESTGIVAQAGGEALGIESGRLTVIVAVLVIAAGTSIPDVLTSIAAARRGQASMAISNAVGSNTFDILVCLGLPYAVVGGQPFSQSIMTTAGIVLGLSIVLLVGLLLRPRLGRGIGSFLLLSYAGFVTYVIM